jgi:Tfp pilus assembly protein PilO
MTGRDRMVLIAIVLVAILGAAWMLVVSPERKKASELSSQVASAQAQLASAEGKVSSAHAAQARYSAAYASIVSLGKAVPPSQEVPSLIEELQQASNQKNVEFSSIASSVSSGSSATASTSVSAGASAGAGLSELPFTFVFEGSYFDLEHLFNQLTSFATVSASGEPQISGRLLTVQSVKLAPAGGTGSTTNTNVLTGSITATAYQMPATQGLSGATGATATGSATPASSAAAASSPTSPAIVRLNP